MRSSNGFATRESEELMADMIRSRIGLDYCMPEVSRTVEDCDAGREED